MTRSVFCLWLVLLGFAPAVHARQTDGYASLRGREIKALSPEQMQDLREGRGMGLSLPAELNGVPGPLHALELQDVLGVTVQQAAELERIVAEMKASAQLLGQEVIQLERDLDQRFKASAIDEQGIDALTQRVALLNGQLRAARLKAHLRTKRLLSTAQIAAYDRARGYMEAAAGAQSAGSHPRH